MVKSVTDYRRIAIDSTDSVPVAPVIDHCMTSFSRVRTSTGRNILFPTATEIGAILNEFETFFVSS